MASFCEGNPLERDVMKKEKSLSLTEIDSWSSSQQSFTSL
jgi:hypothetical protein